MITVTLSLSSASTHPCLNPTHSIPKYSGTCVGLGAATSPQPLGMSQFPTTTQKNESQSPNSPLVPPHSPPEQPDGKSFFAPVAKTCSPNSPFPSSSPAPSQSTQQQEAGTHLSGADSEEGPVPARQAVSVFRVFFLIESTGGVQALLHSSAFKNLCAILLFVPIAE